MVVNDSLLVQIVDRVSSEAVRLGGAGVVCRPGCFECCLGPFEITGLDATRLRSGLESLEPTRADRVRSRAVGWGRGDDEPCPALDPQTGTCDLYDWRPITCRVFGPAISYGSEGVRACDLCFTGAAEEEIAACAVELDIEDLEAELNAGMTATTVAECLAGPAVPAGSARMPAQC